MNKITIVGSGAWGNALAKLHNAPQIAGRAPAQKVEAEIILLAVKAQVLREVLQKFEFGDAVLVICAKGIEQGSLKLLSEIAAELLPNKIAILSGPNFADEIANGLPAAASIACADEMLGKNLIAALGKPNFRLYYSPDIISTQIGGAVKNVIAIAAGICDGKELGENARAALITRGLAEMGRLTESLDGKKENLHGLCGVGDLMLTASSAKSRNYQFGVEIASGKPIDELLQKGGVKEGYYSAEAVTKLAKNKNVEMPICNSVYEILYNNKEIKQAIHELLQRPLV